MLLLACLLVVANAALTAKNAIFVLNTFTSNSVAPTCNPANFLETAYEFAQKNSYSYMWCAQTPTSYLNYLFVFTNTSTVAVQSFPATNVNCTGAPLHLQYITLGKECVLVGVKRLNDECLLQVRACILPATTLPCRTRLPP